MTLKSRNRILLVINIIAFLTFVLNVLYFIYCAAQDKVAPPEFNVRTKGLLGITSAFTYSFNASWLSIMMFSFTAFVLSFLTYRIFEKTQATEVVFFMLFVAGCYLEQFRIFFINPDFLTQNRFMLTLITKFTITGRILAPVSLFFSSVFSGFDQRQYIMRNVLIAILISIMSGFVYPMNTEVLTSIFTLGWGYIFLFSVVRFVIVLATAAILAYSCFYQGNFAYLKSLYGLAFLSTGYFCLGAADNYHLFAGGSFFLAYGSYRYMKAYHELYKWH